MSKNSESSRFIINMIVAILLSGAAVGPASAATDTWIANSGDWFTASNWSAGVPSSADAVHVGIPGTVTIASPGASASSIWLATANSETTSMVVDGAASTWGANTTLLVGGASAATGILTIRNGSQVTTGAAAVGYVSNSSGTMTVDGAGTSLTNGLSVIGFLGAGTLTISGTAVVNNSSGAVELGAGSGSTGTLNIGYGGAAGVLNAPSVTSGSGTATVNFDHSDSAYYFTNNGAKSGTAVLITGSTVVRQIGTGTTILTGSNTYTGGTEINNGTLSISSDANLGNTSGGLSFNGGTLLTTAALSSGRAITLNTGGGTVDTNGNAVTLSGVIGGTGRLTKQGSGSLTLSGANTYSGGTAIDGGTLSVSADANLGNPSGGLSFNGGSLQTTASFTTSRTTTLTAGGGTFDTSTGTTLIDAGVVTGPGGMTKMGAGTLIFTNNANDYTGTTNIAAGTLVLQSPSVAKPYGGEMAVATGAALDVNTPQAIGALSGSGTVTLNAGLTAGNGTSTTFSGVIQGGGFTKQGSGTLTLTGANTYTGGTTVSGGSLQGTTGSLQGNITDNANVTFNQATTGTYGGVISGNGSLTKTGTGTVVLAGANSYTGGTTVSGGSLQGTTGSLQGNITDNANVTFNQATTGTYGGVISGNGSLAKTGTGTVTLTGTNTYTGGTAIDGGTLSVGADTNLGATTGGLSFNGGTLQTTAALSSGRAVGLDAGGGSVDTGSNAVTLSGIISGAGTLTKQGSGSLTLTGANTYTGGTTVSGGSLQGTTGSLQGNITDNANVTFNQATTGTYGGVISGSGSLTKTGTGTVTLTGANSYADGTAIDGGTLSVGADTNLGATTGGLSFNGGTLQTTAALSSGRAMTLNAGGGSVDTGSNAVSLSGIISGAGALTKQGSGSLTLTGANSYTGGTTVSGGSLQGTTGSLQGNITDNANVTFNQATTGTYGGVISGSGSLTKTGAGTVILTGANTYTGGTTVSGGTLQGNTRSLQGNVVDNANVTFDQSADGTFANIISGTGSLTKVGSGRLDLTGVNTFSGSTTIVDGILSVNGAIADSSVKVDSHGTLGGNGTVGTVTLAGGTIAPGNSIGTLHVSGDVNFGNGGVYQVQIDAGGHSDKLVVTGTASLAGADVQIIPAAGTYNFSTEYKILTAGSINGRFSGMASTMAFLDSSLSYDSNNVYLTLTRNNTSFTRVANTPNQRSVAKILAKLASLAPTQSQMASIFTKLLGLNGDGARKALSSLGGEEYAFSHIEAMLGLGNFRRNVLAGRTFHDVTYASYAFNLEQQPMLAYEGGDPSAVLGANAGVQSHSARHGAWLQGFGGSGRTDSTSNAAGARYNTKGLAFGADTDWRAFVLGVAGSYSYSDAETFSGNIGVHSYQVAAYGGWRHDGYYARADTSIGNHNASANRAVVIGVSRQIAAADYHMFSVGADVEVGKRFTLRPDTFLAPYAGLDFSHIHRGAFAEHGAGAADLSVRSNNEDSLRVRFGARLSHVFTSKDGSHFAPYVYAGYARETMDSTASFRAGFSAAPSFTFDINGVNVGRNHAQVGAGIAGKLNKNTSFVISYDGSFARSESNHSYSAYFRYEW